jgi:hypothetical protein
MPTVPVFQNYAGQEISRFGQAAQQAGAGVGDLADKLTREANQVRLDDAMTQGVKLDTDLRAQALQIQGRDAVERADGISLPDEYTKKLADGLQTIEDGLGNDTQKFAFRHQSAQLQQNFYGALSSHVLKQQEIYKDQVSDEKIDAANQRAITIFGDQHGEFTQALGGLKSAVTEKVLRHGGDQDMADIQFRKLADAAYYGRYKAWQQVNPVAALQDFQANQNNISDPAQRDRISDELFRAAYPSLTYAAKGWVSGAGNGPANAPDQAGVPRGVRNNNPGNIMRTADSWQGETEGNDPRYKTFASAEAGIAAMGENLLAYQDKYGLNTINGIVSRWAPATENDTKSYIATVSKALGVKPDDTLNLRDPATMTKLVGAMIGVENGEQPYSDAQIATGVNAALGKAALPATATQPQGAASSPAWRDPNAKTGIPLIDNLPPNQRAQVFANAHAQANQDMSQARDFLTARVNDTQAEYLATGKATNPPSEAEFIAAYGQTEGVQRYTAFQDVATLGQKLQQTRTLSNADLAVMVNAAKPTPGDGFAARERNYEILQKAVSQTIEERQKDPVQFALENSMFGIKPIQDFGNMNSLMAEMHKRSAAMNKIAADYGTRPAIMSNEEADKFGQYLNALQTPDKARILGNLAAATGVAGVQSLSAQLKDKNNTLAIAAMLSPYTTDPTTHWFGPSTPGANVGEMYLEGKDAIAEKRAKIDDTAETGIKAQIYAAISGVYQTPQARDAAAEATYGIYGKLKADGNDDINRAVRLATGGVMAFNGGNIAKPWGWDDGEFKDALSGTVPQAIKAAGGTFLSGGRKISADDFAKSLPGARLQSFGQGSYLVMSGNDVVRNQDGTPYILKVAP